MTGRGAEIRRLAIGALLAELSADDGALRELLAGLPEATLIAVVGEVASLADVVWSTRADHRAAVRESLEAYALELAAR